ncbi:hypothetical protein FQN50_006103 [Emmonsiellopsis sp. PD_5]|nr:hypothetical protein FQN50_006103 [Emmonsiellopsis sp. PD_5]
MGITNFRQPSDLLQRAGHRIDDVGILVATNGRLHTTGLTVDPFDFENIIPILRCGILNKWVSENSLGRFQAANPPVALVVPRICVGPALQKRAFHPLKEDDRLGEFMENEVAFVMVVQGGSAFSCSKVVVQSSRDAVGTAMFSEALNGYSVVFTGVIPTVDASKLWGKRVDPNATITRVSERGNLMEDPKEGEVRIFC